MVAFAPFALRIAVGLVFVMHGWMKLQGGLPGVTGMLGGIGFPMPEAFAVLLIAAELAGGILLILGAFTTWAALVLTVVSFIALVTVHIANGFFVNQGGYEFILLILAVCISLMVTGAGKWSVDSLLDK
ncbi:MAG TPA: DoxX family protein [Candidatus Paceibacterota bacterium]|nr:DoxX family protein [Candidatus Paceibacterota bacterium]